MVGRKRGPAFGRRWPSGPPGRSRGARKSPGLLLVVLILALATPLSASAEDLYDCQSKVAELQRDKNQALADLRAGLFCSECNRSKTEIERGREDFYAHLRDVQGKPVPATQKQLQRALQSWSSKIASAQNRCDGIAKRLEDQRRAEQERRQREQEAAYRDAQRQREAARHQQYARQRDQQMRAMQLQEQAHEQQRRQAQAILEAEQARQQALRNFMSQQEETLRRSLAEQEARNEAIAEETEQLADAREREVENFQDRIDRIVDPEHGAGAGRERAGDALAGQPGLQVASAEMNELMGRMDTMGADSTADARDVASPPAHDPEAEKTLGERITSTAVDAVESAGEDVLEGSSAGTAIEIARCLGDEPCTNRTPTQIATRIAEDTVNAMTKETVETVLDCAARDGCREGASAFVIAEMQRVPGNGLYLREIVEGKAPERTNALRGVWNQLSERVPAAGFAALVEAAKDEARTKIFDVVWHWRDRANVSVLEQRLGREATAEEKWEATTTDRMRSYVSTFVLEGPVNAASRLLDKVREGFNLVVAGDDSRGGGFLGPNGE